MPKSKTYDQLGNRMKSYEAASAPILIDGTPKIIRLDGKAFHSWVKKAGCERPFDNRIMRCMIAAATALMKEIGGTARFAYIQSDECSIVLNDKLDVHTEPWFKNKLSKMLSVSSAIMSVEFTRHWNSIGPIGETHPSAYFDARVFQVPTIAEMHNAILWRQFDASKNSISMYAREYFSHKELHKKSGSDMQEMMWSQHGFNWNDAPTWTKRGVVIGKVQKHVSVDILHEMRTGSEGTIRSVWEPDWDIPLFNKDQDYLKNLFIGELEDEQLC